MKKLFLLFSSVVVLGLFSHAQKGNNQIGVALEVGLPMGDFGDGAKTGFGGSLKGLLGVGTAGQVSLTTGYSVFAWKDVSDAHSFIIPFLLGYRHNFSGVYVEPQLGYGSYGSKFSSNGTDYSSSTGAFTWAIGLGYAMSGLDLGARYQSASKDGGTTSLVGLHVGYNFSLGGSTK
ncbi:MAG: outer membrane beta-barrel protein [Flavisolibacter sp.]